MPSMPRRTRRPSVATLEQVAAEAGVAVSTVSRALSNPKRVNAVTRAEIYKTAKRLGYTVNMAARGLRRGSTRMLMLLLPSWDNSPVISETMRGVERELVGRGYGLVVGHQTEQVTTEQHLYELAQGGLVDGLIIVAGERLGAQVGKNSVFSSAIPSVGLLIDLSGLGIPSVTTNDRSAMYEATRHLIDQGCDRFFYIGGPSGNYHEVERYKGFVKCMKDSDIPPRNFIARNGDFSLQGGFEIAREFLGMQKRPNGVVCASDSMAIGFMKAVRDAGVRVPDDVAVVGFDGIEFGEYCEPPLTTCKQPTLKLGKAGVDLLFDIIEAGDAAAPSRTVIESTLMVRGSSVKTARSIAPKTG